MQNKKIIVAIAVIIFLAGIALARVYYIKTTKQAPGASAIRQKEPVKIETAEKAAQAPAIKVVAQGVEKIPEEEVPPQAASLSIIAQLWTATSEVNLETEEGGKAEKEFILSNNGNADALFNIYKLDGGRSAENDDMAKKLIDYKLSNFSPEPVIEDLAKVATLGGAPWLIVFPYYGVLKAGQSEKVRLSVNARDLKLGEYQASLLILGASKDEQVAVPVFLTVKGAPKIRMVKLEVQDDLSSDTQGNSNQVANPNEKVALTVYLKNEGMTEAKGLTLKLTTDNPALNILAQGTAKIDSLPADDTGEARFLIEVSDKANPVIPPTAYLTITDSKGRNWVENFYLGEEGKFEYPTGLLREEDKNKGQDEQIKE